MSDPVYNSPSLSNSHAFPFLTHALFFFYYLQLPFLSFVPLLLFSASFPKPFSFFLFSQSFLFSTQVPLPPFHLSLLMFLSTSLPSFILLSCFVAFYPLPFCLLSFPPTLSHCPSFSLIKFIIPIHTTNISVLNIYRTQISFSTGFQGKTFLLLVLYISLIFCMCAALPPR